MATKGPPKFKPLVRTTVTVDSQIAPSKAALAEDFSKTVPLLFTGAPPEPEQRVAPLQKQQAKLAGIVIREDAREGVKPAKTAVPSVAKTRTDIIKVQPSIFGEGAVAAKEPLGAVAEEEGSAVEKGEEGAAVEEGEEGAAVEEGEEGAAVEEGEEEEPSFKLKELFEHVTDAAEAGPVPPQITPDYFVPENRRSYKFFLIQTFKKYILPPQSADPDPEACSKAAAASTKELKTFQYQAFVRDYLQRASPYRGLLVYHGLGSGKTCTSIATAEALYGAGNRKIFIMTPASLSANYRGEMSKCGYFAFQQENFWTFLPATVKTPGPELTFLTDTLGLPIDWIRKTKGGWVPDPKKPTNWTELSTTDKAQINEQIQRHVASRFTFINYNGLTEQRVREWACKNPRMFDGAVVVIDEVHNLVRNINNSNLEGFYKQEPLEPEYVAKYCLTGKRYRITYLVYRMLCNAVGCKIVALSGTPIINYPQELGILSNILSGDMRYAGATLNPSLDLATIKASLARNPEVDIFEVTPGDGVISVRISPVPSGYRKVVNPANGEMRGFVRFEDDAASEMEMNRERDLDGWLKRVEANLKVSLRLKKPAFNNIVFGINQRLPDIEKPFVETFINKETLTLNKPNDLVLIARLTGLISYYKAGKPELVARVESDTLVEVEMSDRQLQQYTIVRNAEIKQEERERKGKKKVAPVAAAAAARYDNVVKNQKGTFKIFSRAACNFVFPDEIPRPRPGDDELAEVELGQAKSAGTDADVTGEGEQDVEAGQAKEEVASVDVSADPYLAAIQVAKAALRSKGPEVFDAANLPRYSPKFQAMINNLDTAKGPALIYSQFKTLEGLGIFSIALEIQKDYIHFDLEPQANGLYVLSPALLLPENANKKRYIAYTGDEKAEKRDLLKNIFNTNWKKVPAALAETIQKAFGDSNVKGEIAQLFMITQSGAEGISLESVRQVHLMEPYWNYVRLEQVKGRAIRICSHTKLPFAERTVEVFTYISKFGEAQKRERRVDETLLIKDGGLTTDQSILSISQDKRKLADSLADAMKRAAVDCELNATENGPLACYRFQKPSNELLFHPNLEQDLSDSAAKTRRV
uniref:Helicase ATP-binding domain-containing protein n=1 Tax=viral metagenome TaxID=1070528 RepID=A0A6C0KZB9_9ZZZZ